MFELINVKFLFLYTYMCGKIKYIFKLWKSVEPVEPKMIFRPVQLKNRFLKHCIERQRCADMFSFMHVKAFLGEKQDPRLHVANNKHLLTGSTVLLSAFNWTFIISFYHCCE